MATNAEELATLVLEYLPAGRLRPTAPPQIVARMLELARKIAPDNNGIEPGDYLSGEEIEKIVDDAIASTRSRIPHDPGAYTLENSPAQTGEAGAARFVRDEKPKRLCPHGVEMDVASCEKCYPPPWKVGTAT